MGLILCVTVIGSLAIGIFTSYAAVVGILYTFGNASRPEAAPERPRLVLVPTQTHASGD
jgi:hypothetical protein